ncbi:hypothetical protein PVAP13_7NG024067 [Panicum virgatum]|uniref:Uncharacterized protein n=1 Tax=Panicum virgatum TaxID=38727 RepID=A0A8T0PST0_PANVG|nr:hypothetical protein PVAP13_7NG024067 [Panicum virgatum]
MGNETKTYAAAEAGPSGKAGRRRQATSHRGPRRRPCRGRRHARRELPPRRPSSALPRELPQPRPTGHQAVDAAAAAPQPRATAVSRGSHAPPAAQAADAPQADLQGAGSNDPGGTGSAAIAAGSAATGARRTAPATNWHATTGKKREGRRGRLWKKENFKGKGGKVPAAALIAAEWTSIGELRRRRGGGEEGGGLGVRERRRPSRPSGRRGGRVQNSQYDGPVGGWGPTTILH